MKLNDFGSLCNATKLAKDVDVPNIETIVAGKNISKIILEVADNLKDNSFAKTYDYEKACELIISSEAYDAMQRVLPGVNDDHSIQLLIGYLSQQ